jgi:hypothetical protein
MNESDINIMDFIVKASPGVATLFTKIFENFANKAETSTYIWIGMLSILLYIPFIIQNSKDNSEISLTVGIISFLLLQVSVILLGIFNTNGTPINNGDYAMWSWLVIGLYVFSMLIYAGLRVLTQNFGVKQSIIMLFLLGLGIGNIIMITHGLYPILDNKSDG